MPAGWNARWSRASGPWHRVRAGHRKVFFYRIDTLPTVVVTFPPPSAWLASRNRLRALGETTMPILGSRFSASQFCGCCVAPPRRMTCSAPADAALVGPSAARFASSGRRSALLGVAAFAAAAAAGAEFALPSAQAAVPARMIDVHHHFIPPFYLEENRDRIAGSRGGALSPAWQSWSPEAALAAMDAAGVATAILSLSTPGVWFGDAAAARSTARRVNEYATDLRQKNPGRFGLFAAIPLPDQEASLAEIAYAFDVLKADGIGLLTSYGDKWLGDPSYVPVLQELNRRRAIVFVHPTAPNCCRSLMPGIIPLVSEITQDTTRTVSSLLYAGALRRYADIRFIFTPAGGTLPMVAGRMTQYAPPNLAEVAPDGVLHELRRLHYDIAGTAFAPAIAGLTSLVPITQILLGSDNPYIALAETAGGMRELGLSTDQLQSIGRDNALRLIPRLRTG